MDLQQTWAPPKRNGKKHTAGAVWGQLCCTCTLLCLPLRVNGLNKAKAVYTVFDFSCQKAKGVAPTEHVTHEHFSASMTAVL